MSNDAHGLNQYLRSQINATFDVSNFTFRQLPIDSPNLVYQLILDDGRQLVLKGLSHKYWLGYRTSHDFILHQQVAHDVSCQLGLCAKPYQWFNHSYLKTYQDRSWILVPWVEGEAKTSFSDKMAYTVGWQLAKLHQLSLNQSSLLEFPKVQVVSKSPPWFVKLARDCNQLLEQHQFDTIVSHRDIHAGNIIWHSETEFELIDWESAGLINPFVELIGVALNIAGIERQALNERLFNKVIQAYHNEYGRLPASSNKHWQLLLQSWLLWYAYCEAQEIPETLNASKKSMIFLINQLEKIKMQHHAYC